jgi:DNA-binding transcriptional LysR family regulator
VQQQRPRDKCGSPGALIDDLHGSSPQLLVTYATDDYVTVQSLVAAGLGVTLLPSLALLAARRDDVAVRALAGTPGRTVEVIVPAVERRAPAVEAMIGALRAAAGALAATPAAGALGVSAA